MKGHYDGSKGKHRNWNERKTRERNEEKRKNGVHIYAFNGGKGKLCWCGSWHHKLMEFSNQLKIGVVHSVTRRSGT